MSSELLIHSSVRSLVQIDFEACLRIAKLISGRGVPADREDSSLPGIAKDLVGNFYLALVAICHQTSPVGQLPLEGTIGKKLYRGWDYMFTRLELEVEKNKDMLRPDYWSQIRPQQLRSLFFDPEAGDRLTNPELRAVLLRDLGAKMLAHGWSKADQIYEFCCGRIATASPNLVNELQKFRGYSDPVRKKTYFFLALMRNSGLWSYMDNERLGAPVDYHEVRGHLRLETVRINNAELLDKVRNGREVTAAEDIALRRAVHDAIVYISDQSGLRNPSQVHYLFWNLFRSICTRTTPQCFSLMSNTSLPARYFHFLDPQSERGCPFVSVCPSAGKPDPIWEHVCNTDYY